MKALLIIAIALSACADQATPEGIPGPVGPQGLKGESGVDGARGPEGPGGPQGVPGDPGAKGDPGDVGPAGDTGPAGAQGAPGPQGIAGPQGVAGATGPAGAEGPQGAAGQAALQVLVFDQTGDQLGYPLVIDRGNGMDSAFIAHRDGAPATFPEGRIVAMRDIGAVFFSGTNCTGQAYAIADQVSVNYQGVLYTPQFETVMWEATGPANTRASASIKMGGAACVGSGGSVSAVALNPTGFTMTKPTPWTAAAL